MVTADVPRKDAGELLTTSRLFIVCTLVVHVSLQRQTVMPRALGCMDTHSCYSTCRTLREGNNESYSVQEEHENLMTTNPGLERK